MSSLTPDSIRSKLQGVFQTVFNNPAMQISDEMAAADVKGWDSVAHIDLVLAVEEAFEVEFSTTDIGKMRNIGDLVRLIEKRKS